MQERKIYKWGIIGPGHIAAKFAGALPLIANAVLEAVASRELSRAEQFRKAHCARKTYSCYEALANDPDVDAVYIATPHAFHAEQAILCLNHGKAVLCEKPMALNYGQVRAMVDAAKAKNTFLMEAMWTRFLPVIEKTLALINDGAIGALHSVNADFGFAAPFDPKSRLYNLALGGGSLLDVGVYPLFLALLLLGEPESIVATGKLSATGADDYCRAVLHYRNDVDATIISAISSPTSVTADISGSKGRIAIASPWYKTNRLTLTKAGKEAQEIILEPVINGFEYQIREVMRCLDNGLTESPKIPHAFSLLLAQTMDTIRKQIGVKYPGE